MYNIYTAIFRATDDFTSLLPADLFVFRMARISIDPFCCHGLSCFLGNQRCPHECMRLDDVPPKMKTDINRALPHRALQIYNEVACKAGKRGV